MPRPIKCRKVCHFPNVLEFLPADDTEKKAPIILTVDEYETIRLLDKKGYSQEQCAVSMQIARTTVQRIYEIARKKIADALIDGHPLRIEGGDFRICDGQSSDCNLGGCYKQELYQKYAVEKGEGIMRTKRTLAAMLALSVGMSMTACGGKQAEATKATEEEQLAGDLNNDGQIEMGQDGVEVEVNVSDVHMNASEAFAAGKWEALFTPVDIPGRFVDMEDFDLTPTEEEKAAMEKEPA